MARRKAKSEELEGFQPQSLARTLGPVPSNVVEELTPRAEVKLYLKNEDVPPEMRLNQPPVRDTAPPGSPTIRESLAGIEKMLSNLEAKRSAKAIAEATEHPRKRVARELAEAVSAMQAKGVSAQEKTDGSSER